MVSFCVSVKPEFRGACEDDELTVPMAVAVGSERTVRITGDGVESVFGKFDRGKVTVDRWTRAVDASNQPNSEMEQAGSTL